MNRREMLAGALAAIAEWPELAAAFTQQGTAHDARSQPAALGASDGELVYVGRDPVRIKLSPVGAKGDSR